jgi:putative endonuclease
MYFVYLLKSKKDGKYYIGQTDNIERRFSQHNAGKNISTRNRRPLELIGYEIHETRDESRFREHQLKNHSDKKKKFIEKIESEYENTKKNHT